MKDCGVGLPLMLRELTLPPGTALVPAKNIRFSTLKASARSWNFTRSVTLTVFPRAKSRLLRVWPRKKLRGTPRKGLPVMVVARFVLMIQCTSLAVTNGQVAPPDAPTQLLLFTSRFTPLTVTHLPTASMGAAGLESNGRQPSRPMNWLLNAVSQAELAVDWKGLNAAPLW